MARLLAKVRAILSLEKAADGWHGSIPSDSRGGDQQRRSGKNKETARAERPALTPPVCLTDAILNGVALRAIVERPNFRIGRGVSGVVSAAAEIELHHRPAHL
jgi:hypothetical protein